jgi:hypothetical protein
VDPRERSEFFITDEKAIGLRRAVPLKNGIRGSHENKEDSVDPSVGDQLTR